MGYGTAHIEGNSSQKSAIPTEFLSKFFRNLKTFCPSNTSAHSPSGSHSIKKG